VPPPTTTAVWGAEAWSTTLIEALSQQAVLLASGASRVVAEGRIVHVPRLLVDPDADWVAELQELPSDAGDADTLALTPKKIGNAITVSTESIEDAPINGLDAIGQAMTRGVARKVDARAFSNAAATATAPAGLLSHTLPASAAASPDIAGIITAVAEIAAEGGIANAAFMNAADIGAVQVAAVTGGFSLSDPTRPSVSQIGGAVLYTAPLAAGTALVADARFIAVAVRRDASVDFSEHAPFTKDGVVAKLASERWGLGHEAVMIRTCMKIELSYRPEQANDSESAYYLLRQEWLDLMGGGPGGQRGSLCGSGGGADGAGAVSGWRIDTVTVRGIAAADDLEPAT
jgi:HK97 family phage major capsid protein